MTTSSFLKSHSDLCVTLDGVKTHYLDISKVEEMDRCLRELEHAQAQWFKVFQNIAGAIGVTLTGHGAVDILPSKVREAINAGKDNSEIVLDAPTVTNSMIEELAAVEHEQWSTWAKKIMASEPDLSPDRRDRWTRCMVPFGNLPENAKEQDRRWARKVLPIVAKYFSKLILAMGGKS